MPRTVLRFVTEEGRKEEGNMGTPQGSPHQESSKDTPKDTAVSPLKVLTAVASKGMNHQQGSPMGAKGAEERWVTESDANTPTGSPSMATVITASYLISSMTVEIYTPASKTQIGKPEIALG